jgi:uncharacterized protein (DUF1800 family)
MVRAQAWISFVVATACGLSLSGGSALRAAGRPKAPGALTRAELLWLDRVTFGVDAATVTNYQQLGREKFLEQQLGPSAPDPATLRAAVAELNISDMNPEARVLAYRAEAQRINGLTDVPAKQAALQSLNQALSQVVYDTSKRHLLRAVTSPSQRREQMTWFWMNHFSVFSGKANLRWTIPEYEDTIRSHALDRFSDLVMATVTSPAMLEYLDNAQSARGKINENYARELMELHTLGVSGGPSGSTYTQQDVQELARILTGAGVNFAGTPPRLTPALQPLYVKRGVFEFNPARHDTGVKTVLGHTFQPGGLDEIQAAVEMLCREPATARFVSRKIATYFLSDEPPPAVVDRMARTFQRTDGSIAAVLKTLFLDREVLAMMSAPTPPEKLKDPMVFVISSLRLAYQGKVLTNYRPVVSWLQQLGEPLYGRVTPDGYALTEEAWTSSGQLVKRFEIARAIGSGNAGLFNHEDNTPGPTVGFPMLSSKFFFERIEPALSAKVREALGATTSQEEWNTMLLASPDWMQR